MARRTSYYRYEPRDRITELLLRQGEIGAENALRSGNIMANAVGSLGQQIGAAGQQAALLQQEKQKAQLLAKRDAAATAAIESWDGDPRSLLGGLTKIMGPVEGPKMAQGVLAFQSLTDKQDEQNFARVKMVGETLAKMKPAMFERMAPNLLSKAPQIESTLGMEPGTMEKMSPPELYEAVQSMFGQQQKPGEGFTLSPGQQRFGPDGKPLAAVPGGPPKGPQVGSFEDYVVRAYGDAPTPDQIVQARKTYQQADDRPRISVNVGGQPGDEAQLVEAVAANPSLWEKLTPTVAGKIAPELSRRGFDFGKPLPQAAVTKIAETKSAVDSLGDLRETLKANEQYIGPVAGLAALNPYSEARKAQSQIDMVRQRVGKALEGGVLRKEDEEKYKKILATLRDEPSTALHKVDQLTTMLEKDIETYINEQRLSGRRVNTDVKARGGKKEDPLGIS